MLRVNVIGKSNGVGLTRDSRLLCDALRASGCEVSTTITGSGQSGRRKSWLLKILRPMMHAVLPKRAPRYDINVMLEHVWVQYLHQARSNVVVPNPDFFDRHDVAAVSRVDRVWAKTAYTRQLFEQLGCRVTLTGFDSEDRMEVGSERQRVFFHLAGSSQLKGTARLVQIWARHPHWPQLVVVGRLKAMLPTADNIRVVSSFVEDNELRRMQNESLVHVCTSETEGWGHYLVEAMSVGAAVITLDAPPMNELVNIERGWLLSCAPAGLQRLARRYVFDEAALVATVEELIAMPVEQIELRGRRARDWFVRNQADFHGRIKSALGELNG